MLPIAAQASLPPRSDEADGSEHGEGSDADGPETHVLSLRYPAPALGPVDLRFELDEGSVRITVALAPGEPFAAAQAAAAELRGAVGDATSRSVSVSVVPRREPLEVYA